RQIGIVGVNGRIEIHAPHLPPGSEAEVIVLPARPAPSVPPANTNGNVPGEGQQSKVGASSPTAALDALQNSLKLDRQTAERWVQDVRHERLASQRHRWYT